MKIAFSFGFLGAVNALSLQAYLMTHSSYSGLQ